MKDFLTKIKLINEKAWNVMQQCYNIFSHRMADFKLPNNTYKYTSIQQALYLQGIEDYFHQSLISTCLTWSKMHAYLVIIIWTNLPAVQSHLLYYIRNIR